MTWKVTAQAPTRIDLAGGTLDLWPMHYLIPRAATVNAAVTLCATVEISPSDTEDFQFISKDQRSEFRGNYKNSIENSSLPLFGRILQAQWSASLPPLKITSQAQSPAGAGLGGSSCLAVTLAKALWKARTKFEQLPEPPDHRLVRTAQDAEALIIKAPTGCQDYWGAVRGGINIITFPFGENHVETLAPSSLTGLTEQLTLCYSGKSRASATNNWEIFKRAYDNDKHTLGLLAEIGDVAAACANAVRSGNLSGALECSQQEWAIRKRLWKDIETEETMRLDQAARTAGAYFSRVCGAGGGGVMAIFAAPEKRAAVHRALEQAGGKVLDATTTAQGLRAQ